jgi:KaiC/GvpD/RAD55 family RecA-like ATPase
LIDVSGGGYDTKSLVVYAGEQNIGKSIWLANDAANFVRMGHNVVFITAEMSAQKY